MKFFEFTPSRDENYDLFFRREKFNWVNDSKNIHIVGNKDVDELGGYEVQI